MEILAKSAFLFYCLIIGAGAVMAVMSKSLVRALVGLIAVMIALAGMYLLLAAPFIAFMQILIYVGGVSVLIFFAIMLSKASAEGDETGSVSLGRAVNALLCLLVPAVIFSVVIIYHPVTTRDAPLDVSPALLGEGMLGPYLLPFELISVVLFAAMAGAVLAAWRKRGQK
ncbi:NADH-ubiquinone/plastoquinone oxidoreductase chain 6 [delta proteobacterium NaphS2]|nr:NADH-ubiquinone/plastoquinone oxidoreductase chain 6 [delta proteobacterium NaphS2]